MLPPLSEAHRAPPIEILLVDDSEPDVILTREAFAQAGVLNHMHVARDGVEALDLLRGALAGHPPDVILLDINMPRMSGLETLEALKNDPELAAIPVIMLTTSAAEEDILRSYQHQAASYVVKPVEFARFYEVIRALGTYMLNVVRVPPRERGPAPEGRGKP